MCSKAKDPQNSDILDARFTKIDHLPGIQQKIFRDLGITDTYMEFYEFLKFKYLINADGYSCAWKSLFLKLASPSLTVILQSDIEQWYFRELLPWVHYVPMRFDAKDVIDVYEWLIGHSDEVEEIIRNANKLVSSVSYGREIERTVRLLGEIAGYRRYK